MAVLQLIAREQNTTVFQTAATAIYYDTNGGGKDDIPVWRCASHSRGEIYYKHVTTERVSVAPPRARASGCLKQKKDPLQICC